MDPISIDEADHLFIVDSQIANSGKGLFTAIPIYKDEIISYFEGKLLTVEEAQNLSNAGNDNYFINMPDGSTLDSEHIDCFAKYANDAKGLTPSNFKNNCKIALDDQQRVCLIANCLIESYSEIFCSYGKIYWKNYRRKLSIK